jgi:head-tail adaptor
VNAGKLNRRVRVMQRSTVRDAAGGESFQWLPVLNGAGDAAGVWASIDIQYSALTYETSEFISKATYRIEMRRTRSLLLNIADRIHWTDPASGTLHVYEIESIPPDPDNMKLLLLCYELDGNQ